MKRTYAFPDGRMVRVERRVNPHTGEVTFAEAFQPIDYDELRRSYDLFIYGGAVGHRFGVGTYRLDGTPLPGI